jgi:predicted secreted protein
MNRLLIAAACAAALIVPLLSVPVTAVAQSATQPPAAAQLRLSINNNWDSHIVAAGNMVSVALPENMSTGLSWKFKSIDGDGITVVNEAHSDNAAAPGAPGSYSLLLKAGNAGRARVTMVESKGFDQPAREFVAILNVGTRPTTPLEAATAFTVQAMHLQCDGNNEPNGTVDKVFIEDGYVLATFTCGHLHGEHAFELNGLAQKSKLKTKIGGIEVSVSLKEQDLLWLGMSRFTAITLLDQRNLAR